MSHIRLGKNVPNLFFHAPYIPGHRHPQYGFEKRIHLRCSLNQTLVVYVVDDNQSGIPLKYLLLVRYKHDCINNFPIIVGFEFPMSRKTPFTSCKLVFRHIHPQKKGTPFSGCLLYAKHPQRSIEPNIFRVPVYSKGHPGSYGVASPQLRIACSLLRLSLP